MPQEFLAILDLIASDIARPAASKIQKVFDKSLFRAWWAKAFQSARPRTAPTYLSKRPAERSGNLSLFKSIQFTILLPNQLVTVLAPINFSYFLIIHFHLHFIVSHQLQFFFFQLRRTSLTPSRSSNFPRLNRPWSWSRRIRDLAWMINLINCYVPDEDSYNIFFCFPPNTPLIYIDRLTRLQV